MWKIGSRRRDRELCIINKSSPNEKYNAKLRIEKIGEIKPLSENRGGILLFDYYLGSSSNKHVDQFFPKRKI